MNYNSELAQYSFYNRINMVTSASDIKIFDSIKNNYSTPFPTGFISEYTYLPNFLYLPTGKCFVNKKIR